MSVIIFIVVLFVLILVHEWGHFIVAKKTGMRVDEFGIGFPPKLYGLKKGETEYTINAFPIGGFVKILGEDGGADAGTRGDDWNRSFAAKSKWAQAAVLVAGVSMNIIFAWLLLVMVFMIGVPSAVEEGQASDDARLVVTEVLADSPADQAGLPVGASITAISASDDSNISPTPSSFASFVGVQGDNELTIEYQIGDEARTVNVTPATGFISDDNERLAIGVALSMVETKQESLVGAIVSASERTYNLLVAITVGITTLIFDAFTFSADFSQVAGPVGIVSLVGDAASFGFTSLLVFTAVISLNLAVINMLPFPVLDGGRLLFVAIEAVIKRPINPIWMARVNFAGFALLIMLMVAVTYSDILKLF